MIYLDSSALVKLLWSEQETPALREWLEPRRDSPMVSSHLARVEVTRVCRRYDLTLLRTATALLDSLALVPLRAEVLDEAATVGDDNLRSLDAIHLASALSIRSDLTDFVAYDRRLSEAARAVGLPSVTP